MSNHLSWLEAGVIGAVQGVSELFPVSSLGHSVLIPAVIGGSWAKDLDVSSKESPYLAFIVGLHVATAIALIIFFWRDWLRIVRGLGRSIRHLEIADADEKLAWLLILGTIPVGLAGVLFEHEIRTLLAKPIPTAIFLALNGLVLLLVERLTGNREEEDYVDERESGVVSDARLAEIPKGQGVLIASAQILALAPGISRSGVTMAAGLFKGLSREDAARFSFLLATPVILAAGALKLHDLTGPLGAGIRPQVLFGSLCSGVGAYLSVRFLTKYFATRSLRPFGVYCMVAGIGCLIWFLVR